LDLQRKAFLQISTILDIKYLSQKISDIMWA